MLLSRRDAEAVTTPSPPTCFPSLHRVTLVALRVTPFPRRGLIQEGAANTLGQACQGFLRKIFFLGFRGEQRKPRCLSREMCLRMLAAELTLLGEINLRIKGTLWMQAENKMPWCTCSVCLPDTLTCSRSSAGSPPHLHL